MTVLLISGKAQHGKDTSAQFIKNILIAEEDILPRRILITHYADLLKWVAKQFFDWNGEKDKAGRTLLQTIGQRVRAYTPDYWCNAIWQIIGAFADEWDYVLIPDVRYPNELLSAYNTLGAEHTIKHIRVIRPGFDNGLTAEQQQHESETALDGCTADRYIDNSADLSDLFTRCKDLVKELIGNGYINRSKQDG